MFLEMGELVLHAIHASRMVFCVRTKCPSFLYEKGLWRDMEDQVEAEYESLEPPLRWLTLSETELQAKMLVDKRIRTLRSLLDFVFATKRFPEGRVDLSYYEL